jgi:putative transposase
MDYGSCTMEDVAERFHRRSVRMRGFDYTLPGAYFVTIVTHKHNCIFGKIFERKMSLNAIGVIAHECWSEIPDHFHCTDIFPFIVMPNHIHGIITIIDDECRGTIMHAHAGYRAPTTEKFSQPVAGSVPTIIRTYKAAISRRARQQLGMVNLWQRNYYEHIVRNQSDLESIAEYIIGNPANWADDSEHPQ